MDDAQRCRLEVEELHACFEGWFTGREDADLSRCEAVLSDDFEMVSPDGVRRGRRQLMTALAAARGVHALRPFAIGVRAVEARPVGAGVFVVAYEEWHHEAGHEQVRLSTAVLRDAPGRPRGLQWLTVHETWRATGGS